MEDSIYLIERSIIALKVEGNNNATFMSEEQVTKMYEIISSLEEYTEFLQELNDDLDEKYEKNVSTF